MNLDVLRQEKLLMAGESEPFAEWARRDWIAFAICIAISMAVMDGIKEAAGDSLGFWPMIAVRIAAGAVAFVVAYVSWGRLIRPKL